MKSGVQLNFIERRVRADRALSQLVRITRETTEALSSREQRGLYRLETTLAEKTSNGALSAHHVVIGSTLAARWKAISIIVLTLVRAIWARVGDEAQHAFVRVRAAWGPRLAPIFIVLKMSVARGGAELRKLRERIEPPFRS